MEMNDTRRRLIELIAEHHASHPGKKLGIEELSRRAGISRQSFNRYYKDLTDYAAGRKLIGDLVDDTTNAQTKQLINQQQEVMRDLQEQVEHSEIENAKKLKKAMDSYVTSLMVNDLTAHAANSLRITLEKQTVHNLQLKQELTNMEVSLAKAQANAATLAISPTPREGKGEKVKLDVDLSKAVAAFSATKSEDDFEDKKEIALKSLVQSICKLALESKCSIVLFAERYVSRFSSFYDNFSCPDDGLHIIARLPVFYRSELRTFIDKLPPTQNISLYIPYLESASEKKAQRSFYFNSIPKCELDSADEADVIPMTLGLDRIIQFRVKQGD
ncbi:MULTISPECIES: TetR/AcrR family transcriptional regulator [Pseudomonas]|jgi:AcrR family transcriptional regulator|uniref:Uncharacterized protein n=2 Tax=Pseudomonas putida TaxID=303 RepID=Q88LH1_PSEPK|nr:MULTISPECIES: TetR/AcrR family transcriptional regulator [Pseudomonas]AAN67577.1 conserved protein of unknown function [Pseudomonas putida KT2440]KAF0250720.1 hypothetical protein GN299_32445 [Pseudomonas putida]KMU96581.1 hypothetical protein AC138_07515 [Pseudomonas putida]KMY35786.1 hypothetical protein AA993_10120 [Pseudomonas putida]MDD2080718.1 TetR/AcrR family transcriptional regulator [Pseudomonas putida]